MTTATDQVRRTGIFYVSGMYDEHNNNPGFIEYHDRELQRRLTEAIMIAISDGRQYSVQVKREEATRKAPVRGCHSVEETTVKWVATVLLVHAGDCEPGEWAIAFEEGEDIRIRRGTFRVNDKVKGCVERVC